MLRVLEMKAVNCSVLKQYQNDYISGVLSLLYNKIIGTFIKNVSAQCYQQLMGILCYSVALVTRFPRRSLRYLCSRSLVGLSRYLIYGGFFPH